MCSPGSSPVRGDVLQWAKQVVPLGKALKSENADHQVLVDALRTRIPTHDDCLQLREFTNQSSDLYNQMVRMHPPEQARSVYLEFVEAFSSNTDADRYYALYVCQNDVSYYDLHAQAVEATNRRGETALHDFKQLLEQYSISCGDVDMCE